MINPAVCLIAVDGSPQPSPYTLVAFGVAAHDRPRAVGRSIVDRHDLAHLRLIEDVLEHDVQCSLLVEGGDHDREHAVQVHGGHHSKPERTSSSPGLAQGTVPLHPPSRSRGAEHVIARVRS